MVLPRVDLGSGLCEALWNPMNVTSSKNCCEETTAACPMRRLCNAASGTVFLRRPLFAECALGMRRRQSQQVSLKYHDHHVNTVSFSHSYFTMSVVARCTFTSLDSLQFPRALETQGPKPRFRSPSVDPSPGESSLVQFSRHFCLWRFARAALGRFRV